MIRLALVGVGGYGWTLHRWIHTAGRPAGARLVAAADVQMTELPERAARLLTEAVALSSDATAMFERLRGQCDGVYIATGIASHEALTVAALEAGYHVHVEKPPAGTVQEVDRMLAAAERNDRVCTVGFQAAHGADIRAMRDAILAGRIGAVRSISVRASWPRTRSYYERNDWAGSLKRGDRWVLDGPANNALAHQLTNMLVLAGGAPNVFAAPKAVRAELYIAGPHASHDTAFIEIATAEGPTLYWMGSHAAEKWFGPTLEVRGERGSIEWTMRTGGVIRTPDGEEEVPYDFDAHGRMVEGFCECIRTGDPSRDRCPLREARKMTLVIDGAHESAGALVRVPEAAVRRIEPGTGGERSIVDGLDERIRAAADRGCLLSDLPDAPDWARPTAPFDLADYTEFPVRFRPD